MTGENSQITASYDTIFLTVSVEFTHLGYRGGGTSVFLTPDISVFTLNYKGTEYKPVSLSAYMQDVGIPSQSKNLDRREVYESVLVFEIEKEYYNQNFDDSLGYLKINLGDLGVQIWSLEKQTP